MPNELTVEEALKELREMFPQTVPRNNNGRSIYIEINQTARSGRSLDEDFEFTGKARIHIEYASGSYSAPLVAVAPTLSEAMAQVRKWHSEQSSSTPDRKR